jgi:ADP-heptose:LPS heptosyltransferase
VPPSPKILVLSITRMGDLVQSIPFFRRLRLRNPDSEIHILVENCFADVARLIPELNQIHTVTLEDLLPNLAAGRNHNLAEATSYYRDLVGKLKHERFGEIWNLTHTRPSMVLNFLLANENGRGVTLDGYGLQRVNSPWLIYFFAANLARPWCQFNLVDIYANCVNGVEWSAGRDLSFRSGAVSAYQPAWRTEPARRRRIALHVGASQKSKQWPTAAYRQVAERLARNPETEIVLIGGRRDQAIADEFAAITGVVSAIGQTDVPELASLLSSCDLLISNDSGPMHVAAAVKTPVIAVTVGSALGSETAPYGEGHLVIEPDSACFPCSPQLTCNHTACAARIPVDAVAVLAQWRLGLRNAPPPDDLAGMHVYQTGFSPQDGCLSLSRLFNAIPSERDELNRLMRPAWLAVLEKRAYERADVAVPAELAQGAKAAVPLARRLQSMARQLASAAEHASHSLSAVENLGRLISRAESEITTVLNRHGLLRSLLAYMTIARASLTADDLQNQARETAGIYQRLSRLLSPIAGFETMEEINEISASSLIEDSHENLS